MKKVYVVMLCDENLNYFEDENCKVFDDANNAIAYQIALNIEKAKDECIELDDLIETYEIIVMDME